jgi:hypothetical protein
VAIRCALCPLLGGAFKPVTEKHTERAAPAIAHPAPSTPQPDSPPMECSADVTPPLRQATAAGSGWEGPGVPAQDATPLGGAGERPSPGHSDPTTGGGVKVGSTPPPLWAHLLCALWVPEATLGDPERLGPVLMDAVPKDRFLLVGCAPVLFGAV